MRTVAGLRVRERRICDLISERMPFDLAAGLEEIAQHGLGLLRRLALDHVIISRAASAGWRPSACAIIISAIAWVLGLDTKQPALRHARCQPLEVYLPHRR